MALQSRGGLISSVIAVSVAKTLIARNPHLMLDHIDLDSLSWQKAFFAEWASKKRMKTTGKIEILDGAKKEAQLLYLHDIVYLVEDHNIPNRLILNVPSANHTLAKKGSKSIGIVGSDDKRCIIETITVSLKGGFLPMKLIYGGKANQSLPRFKFPESFSLSMDLKHYSSTLQSIKNIEKVIIPNINAQQEILSNPNQAALLILDVFRLRS